MKKTGSTPRDGSRDGMGDEPIISDTAGGDGRAQDWSVGVAHPARVYDYLLGGKDNYASDRAVAEAMIARLPTIPDMARANRAFLGRAVRLLVGRGVDQFLDIGCGLPTVDPVHEVAQTLNPAVRVVYVDDDPMVLSYSRALLRGTPAGQVEVMHGDVRNPEELLSNPVLDATLYDARPIAVMLVSLLMYFDDDDAHGLISAVVDAMPPGSYLTVSHPTADFHPSAVAQVVEAAGHAGVTYRPRSRAEVLDLFAGLDLIDPGVVPLLDWHPTTPDHDPERVYYWAGMARTRGEAGGGKVLERGRPMGRSFPLV